MVEEIRRKNLGRDVLSYLQMEREVRLTVKTKLVDETNEIRGLGDRNGYDRMYFKFYKYDE